jgi:vitamin B12/bleomycin/antimicrobial peptide transport system ATP-binding/permease protein
MECMDNPINDPESAGRQAHAADAQSEGDNIFVQFRELWQIVLDPHAKRDLARLGGAIALMIGLNALVQIRLNNWNGDVYNAISLKNVSLFIYQAEVFLLIVSILLCLGVAQTWLHELLKVRLRKAVTFDLLAEWFRPRRIFQLKQSGDISTNPDQRIQDDARRLSELSVDLAVGLLQSSFLLIAFTGVLWQLSARVKFLSGGHEFTIPGYMVWASIVYASLGSAVTWLVGRPLIAAHSEMRSKEARFRFALVRVSESADEIALFRGEGRERHLLKEPAEDLFSTMRHIANRLAGLTWVTGGYGWFAIITPLLLASPGYFGGSLNLGDLMMVVGGFYQVQNALRWYVDKFPVIAEWRAMLNRISSYRRALERLPVRDDGHPEINFEIDGESISAEKLRIYWNGDPPLRVEDFKIEPRERVLIEALPKSGKSTLHKTLAGLWRRGKGTVRVPPPEHVLFLPQPVYLPMGSLMTALCYPDPPDAFKEDEAKAALDRTGLGQLATRLNEVKRWDKELSLEERRRLILGRMLLHRPLWVIQDESIYELDDETRKTALSILSCELKDTAVLSIGRRYPNDTFYQRVLSLESGHLR